MRPVSRFGGCVALALLWCLVVGEGCGRHEPPEPPALVRDIRPGPGDSWPDGFAALDGIVCFSADDGVHGRELWRSDGTAAGTWLVSDIRPGPDSSGVGQLTRHAGRLFFVAEDGVHGEELWVTDGTPAGTRVAVPVPDWPGSSNLTSAAGRLYFSAAKPASAPGAWRSDGTPGGTFPLVELGADEKRAGAADFYSAPALGVVFFTRRVTLVSTEWACCWREELWRTDGSPAGTARVAAFDLRRGDYPIDWIGYLAELPPRLLFFETEELWSSDGTTDGTHRVASGFQYFGGSHGAYGRGIGPPAVLQGRLWFTGVPLGEYGRRLWVTDGTAPGTQSVSDLALGLGGWGSPSTLAVMGGRLYFMASRSGDECGLYRISGEARPPARPELVGTLVRDSNAPSCSGQMAVVDEGLVLEIQSNDEVAPFDRELWWSDGTSGGTERLIGGLGEMSFRQLSVAGDSVFFAAETDAAGLELWALRLR